nr:MAG TPA: hypothetical protein [Crassvirales sp.]
MKISNFYDDLSITDVQEKAAPVGDSLRVAVTKTSAQGKAAQSATPNLMSFSTDENSVWFNRKKYGVYILRGFENLSTDSTTGVIQSFLGDFTYDRWVDAVNTGNIVFVETNDILTPASVYANSSEGLNIMFVTPTYTYSVSIHYSTGSGYSIDLIQQDSLVRVADVNNTLTSSSTDKPLSAAMGKKLNDEKLAKTDVVNSLSDSSTNKALSAAQGKALNDKISSNKISINFSAISNTSDSATIKGYMGNLDGTTLVTKLTYGATLIDSSSEDWVITPQEVSASKVVFVGLKLQSFHIFTKTITVTISGSNYTNMAVITADRYVPNVVNNLTSSDTANALSAAQGKALNDKISALGSVYRVKGSKTNISEVLALTDAKVGDVWNVINAFTLNGKPFPASTNIVCVTATSPSDHDEGNWDPIGGTVNLSAYIPKSDIVNVVTSQDTNKPLSAAQGYKLQTEKFAKNDVKSSYDSSTSTVYSTQYLNNREEDFEEDVRATVGPIYIPLNEKGTKTIQQQSITSDFTLVWLADMKKIVAKSSSGSYYNNWKIENDLNPSNRDALLVVKDTTTNSPITGHIYILGDYSYRWDGSNFIQIDKTPLPTDYHYYINGLPRLANSTPSSLEEVFGSFDNFKRGIESSKAIWVDTMYSGDIICSRRTLDNVTCAIFEGALTLRTSGTAEKDAYSGVYYIQCVIKYNSSGFLDGPTVKLYEDSIMPYYITDFPEKASNDGGRTDMDAFLGTLKDFEAAFKAGRPFRLLQSSETNTSSSNIIIVSKRSGAHSYYVQRIFATNLSDGRTCTKLHVINPTSDSGTKWEKYSILINTELVPLSRVVDSLDSTSLYPLSANQGKQLKSLIDKVKTGIIIE